MGNNNVPLFPLGLVHGQTHSYNIQIPLIHHNTAYELFYDGGIWFPVAVAQAGYGYFLRKCYKPN